MPLRLPLVIATALAAPAALAAEPKADLESQLATQREWLSAAGGAASSGGQPGAGSPKRSTTAWVRADG